MRFVPTAILCFILIFILVPIRRGEAAPPTISIVGPIEPVSFGTLMNAPNGHISFRKEPGGFRLWVPGRLDLSPTTHDEGGFLFDVPGWSFDDLAQAQPTLALGHFVDEQAPDCGSYVFDR